MVKKHGAKQQKKAAKKKAKREEKRTELAQRTSSDPTVRLRGADKWPVYQAWAATSSLWKEGMGYLAIARHEPKSGGLIYGTYLVDTWCLGVKNAFWHSGSTGEFKEMIQKLDSNQPMDQIAPACLVKIIQGALEYAESFGFRPHHDFRHASLLLGGIDPSECPNEYTFGKDGKPFYVRGPGETPAQALVIMERVRQAGGDHVLPLRESEFGTLGINPDDLNDDDDEYQDDDDNPLGLPQP